MPVSGELWLFVPGEPGAGNGDVGYRSFWQTMLGAVSIPAIARTSSHEPARLTERGDASSDWSIQVLGEDTEWHVPSGLVASVELVIDVARRERRPLTIVNVDRPGEALPIVDRFVRPSDVFPVLVRADGERLAGEQEFTRSGLRRFLR